MAKEGNMNKKCKIITAFCTVGVTAAALLFGCALKSDNLPTVTMVIPGEQQSDLKLVLEEANKITSKKIGANIDIQFVDLSAYTGKMLMRVATKDKSYDISWTGYSGRYTSMTQKGAYYPLTELIDENAPELWDAIESYMWEDSTIDGEIYAVPNSQITFYQYGYAVQKDLADKYGFDKDKIDDPKEFEPFLKKIKECESELYPFCGNYRTDMWTNTKYERLNEYLYIKTDGDYSKVLTVYDIPEYIDAIKTLSEWYKKGYIRADRSVISDEMSDIYNNKYAVWDLRWKPGGESQLRQTYGKEYKIVKIGEPYMNNRNSTDTMLAINKSSENKEKAIKLISLLNTDKEFYNLICFGIKDKHYVLDSDNKVEYIEGSGYNLKGTAWQLGNQFNAYIIKGDDDNVWEETKRLNKEARKSPISGFYFNPNPVADKIAKIGAVFSEHYSISYEGGDVDTRWNVMKEQLAEAGYADLQQEMQRQLDEFLNKKQ